MATRQGDSTVSAIFFDLDNTLIATRKADRLACNKVAEILWKKCDISPELALSISSSFLREFRKCPDNPSMNLDAWRHLLWEQALGDRYQNLAGDIYPQWLQLRFLFLASTPEIRLLLNKLRHQYLLGLITNGPSHAQWEKINHLDLQKYFDVIVVSGDMPWEKPHPKIFQEACHFLKVEPDNCIMVGDKLETDILGGIQAKLGGTVLVPLNNNELRSEIQPDYIINDVLDLPLLLPNYSSKIGIERRPSLQRVFKGISLCFHDLDDCNSNSSDGS